jgi:hypothetical protein
MVRQNLKLTQSR